MQHAEDLRAELFGGDSDDEEEEPPLEPTPEEPEPGEEPEAAQSARTKLQELAQRKRKQAVRLCCPPNLLTTSLECTGNENVMLGHTG